MTATGATTDPNAPIQTNVATGLPVGANTGTESNLSNWVGPYATDMLGRGQALSERPYDAYMGPLTAGTTGLQDTAFQGLANLAVPTGQMGTYEYQSWTDPGMAQSYMDPFATQALQPTIDETTREYGLKRLADQAALTQAGAYGGSRDAIMNAENTRNWTDSIGKIWGQGHRDAYETARDQFNTEQAQRQAQQQFTNDYGIGALGRQLEAGGIQRDILSEGIDADRAQFEEERDNPWKQVQYMQSLLQGLPLAAQQINYQTPTDSQKLSGAFSSLLGQTQSGGGLLGTLLSLYGNNDAAAGG